jgi:hypothetical protein
MTTAKKKIIFFSLFCCVRGLKSEFCTARDERTTAQRKKSKRQEFSKQHKGKGQKREKNYM